jgi:hypothetical protein
MDKTLKGFLTFLNIRPNEKLIFLEIKNKKYYIFKHVDVENYRSYYLYEFKTNIVYGFSIGVGPVFKNSPEKIYKFVYEWEHDEDMVYGWDYYDSRTNDPYYDILTKYVK